MANRSIYHDGWIAAVVHMVNWENAPTRTNDFTKDKWELCNMREDFGLATDLADKYPEKVEFMKALFYQEALKNNVFPQEESRYGAERVQAWSRTALHQQETGWRNGLAGDDADHDQSW